MEANLAIDESNLDRDVVRIFEYYKSKFARNTKYAFNEQRRKKIATRLKEFSVADLMTAIDNLALSGWHNGRNDRGKCYNSLELVFRNNSTTYEWVHRYDPPEDKEVVALGVALCDNYKIYFKKSFGREPEVTKEHEMAFYPCAQKIIDAGLARPYSPQAIMLAFIFLNPAGNKTIAAFVNQLDWLLTAAPISRRDAVPFLRRALGKKLVGVDLSQVDAEDYLQGEGLFYE